ncbi:MAG: AMP-dependent synthetase, partial [Clostridia bacterium]|nr:AMP-dependent synthetase [Clostridia bacterium]
MKLSFSTKGWHNQTFEEFCQVAVDLKFEGVELHNIHNRLFTDKDGAFHDYAAAATLRRLYEQKLQIPCIDAIGDIADAAAADAVEKEVEACLDIASNLHIPFIRLRAESTADVTAGVENTAALLEKLLPKAEERSVALLVETSGLFCDTAELRNLLDRFASDWLAALWNLSAAYFGAG